MSNQPASIHSQVWHDVDGDGIQDSGEGGVLGVKAELFFAGADGASRWRG